MITAEERAEILRVLDGGDLDASFFNKRLADARKLRAKTEVEKAQENLQKLLRIPRSSESCPIMAGRENRKRNKKIQKAKGTLRKARREQIWPPYVREWTDEERRNDNLRSAAIYLDRANKGVYI